MKLESESSSKRTRLYVLLSALAVVIIIGATAYYICTKAMAAERHARYTGIMNLWSHRTCRLVDSRRSSQREEVKAHAETVEDNPTAHFHQTERDGTSTLVTANRCVRCTC